MRAAVRGLKIDPPLPCSSTALDLACDTPQKRRSSALNLLAGALALGIGMQIFGPPWVRSLLAVVKLNSMGAFSALLVAGMAAMVFHEAGHLLAALLLDFEILGGSLGPVRATHFHGKWTIQFSNTSAFAGSVSAIPRDNRSWRMRMLVVVAAGPATTFLTGIASALILLYGDTAGWTTTFWGALLQFSFFIFVLGLIPNEPKATVWNDARLFSCIWRNGPEAQEVRLYHTTAQLSAAGVRPREYPEEVIRKLALARGRPEAGLLYAHTIAMWAIDRGDIEAADAWDRRSLDLSAFCDVRLRSMALARSACFDVLFRDDPVAADQKFRNVAFDRLMPSCFMHRAQAARWIAKGNFAEALAEMRLAESSFPKELPYYEFERTLLGRLGQKTGSYGLNPRR